MAGAADSTAGNHDKIGRGGSRDALCLHRHRVKHHASARRGARWRAAARGRLRARVHAAGRAGADARRRRAGQDRRGRRGRRAPGADRRGARRAPRCASSPRPPCAARPTGRRWRPRSRPPAARRLEILDARDEARLAFGGAIGMLARCPAGPLGVVDVGGGSTELVVGTAQDGVTWSVSLPLGSSVVTHSEPPLGPADAGRARARARRSRRQLRRRARAAAGASPTRSAAARRRCSA